MLRLALVPVIAASLAACDGTGPTGEPDGPLRTDTEGNSAADKPPAAQSGALPPEGPGPRFVGRWAASEEKCQSSAWRLTDSTLRTDTGESCSFNRVTEVENGYDIQATCTADGSPTSDRLRLHFADEAKAMTVESETLAGGSLVFCGRDA